MLTILEGVGHFIRDARPNELAAVITSFLAEHVDA